MLCSLCNKSFINVTALTLHSYDIHYFRPPNPEYYLSTFHTGEWKERQQWVKPSWSKWNKTFAFYQCSLKCKRTWFSSNGWKFFTQTCSKCNKKRLPTWLWQSDTNDLYSKPYKSKSPHIKCGACEFFAVDCSKISIM